MPGQYGDASGLRPVCQHTRRLGQTLGIIDIDKRIEGLDGPLHFAQGVPSQYQFDPPDILPDQGGAQGLAQPGRPQGHRRMAPAAGHCDRAALSRRHVQARDKVVGRLRLANLVPSPLALRTRSSTCCGRIRLAIRSRIETVPRRTRPLSPPSMRRDRPPATMTPNILGLSFLVIAAS